MPGKPVVAIVDASKDEFKHCRQSLPKYRCLALPRVEGMVDMTSLPPQVELLLVYAGKTQQETMGICQQLRRNTSTAGLPILLVVNRYDVTQAFIVKQTGNADLILSPFKGEDLRDSVDQLRSEQMQMSG
jgi:PleD family two-component response regulator